MSRIRQVLLLATAVVAIGCGGGGGGSTGPNNNNGNNNGNNGGSVKVVTATLNGQPFTATTVSGAYLSGQLSITAFNASRSINITAINLAGTGTISLNVGNQWSALGQIGGATEGTYSTGYGGVGTVTLTTATLFRVTGTFSFTAYSSSGSGLGQPVITVTNGVFDISNP